MSDDIVKDLRSEHPSDVGRWHRANRAAHEIESLRAQLASARKALQFIADGYENHDINHVDYRVKVYQVAAETLEEIT